MLEVVIRHIWQTKFKKGPNPEGTFVEHLEALNKRRFISDEWKAELEQMWSDRHFFHHLRPAVDAEHQKLEETARNTLRLLHDLQRGFFGYTVQEGMIVPEHPEYWTVQECDV